MAIIQIDADNIDREHICCAIGADKENSRRALTKKDWLKERFRDGLVFKRLDARGKVFVEYMPIERVWKPVVGSNYLMINCLWVSGQFKGQGYAKQLLDECITEARMTGKHGVAVITSSMVKPFLTDKRFYLKHGFVGVDKTLPYFELLVLRFDEGAPFPQFAVHAKEGNTHFAAKGFTFVYSNQCPFMEDFAGYYVDLAKKHGFQAQAIHLKSAEEAQRLGSPFGTFGAWLDGKFLFHDLMTESKFERYLESLKKITPS